MWNLQTIADLHDEIIVLSRLFVGSCATVGLTVVQCQLGRPATPTECSFSESMSFSNAVKTVKSYSICIHALPLLHYFFMFLLSVDLLSQKMQFSVQRNVAEGHQAGQMVEQSNKEKSAKSEAQSLKEGSFS